MYLRIQAAALLLLGLFFNISALHARPASSSTLVLEAQAEGLARLDVRFTVRGKELSRFEFKGEEGLVVGAITLPSEPGADYEITAFDREGNASHAGKGSIPAQGEEGRPLLLPLPPTGDANGLVVSLTRERLVLSSSGEPNNLTVHVDVFDPLGNPTKIEPLDIRYELSDVREFYLKPDPDRFNVDVVPRDRWPNMEILCVWPPVLDVCLPNGHCREIPVCVDPWTTVSAGAAHTCGLTKNGIAYCWGLNGEGQLGAPTTTPCSANPTNSSKCSKSPLPVACPAGAPCQFTQISAGDTLTAAIDINGDAWWWGRGGVAHHKVNAMLAGSSVKFSSIAAGYGHACAISQARSEIWCWGTNAFGEAGLPARTPYEVPDWAPARVLAPVKFQKVVAGGEHTCAIGSTGVDVVCFGRDDVGINQTKGPSSTQYPAGTGQFFFQHFGGLTPILDVAASAGSSCVALGWNNGVRCWGKNAAHNLVPFGSPERVTTGEGQVCALSNQLASCVGTNNWGELGIGSAMNPGAPAPVKAPPPLYSAISAGSAHTCGVTPDGAVYCWGNNLSGQVGNGATNYSVNAPSLVVKP